MSQITTHILDTSLGRPAAGVQVLLLQATDTGWQDLTSGVTNADGRISDLLPPATELAVGIYKLAFVVQEYFERQNVKAFYPVVEICFAVTAAEHYHVPLLLNPFGYSTYRGS